MTDPNGDPGSLPPLEISCTSSNCENDQHCYLATKRMITAGRKGRCRSCGAALVDWSRVHERDLADAAYTFKMMRTEFIRHHFWHVDIDQRAVNYAKRKGRRGLREAAVQRIRTSVSAARPPRDGRQTGWHGNPLYYAQHATATCCRRCIEEWHAIHRGRPLTDDEIRYLSSLVVLYLEERFPDLKEDGEYVPPIRRAARLPRVMGESASSGDLRKDTRPEPQNGVSEANGPSATGTC